MIEPVGHFVLIEMPKLEEKTAGGVYLPPSARDREERASVRGEIKGIGPQCKVLAAEQVGRIALFGRYAGAMIEDGGTDYRLIDEDEIRGVV